MPIRIPDRVLLFDYGEVISLSPTEADRAALLELAGVAAEPFWRGYAEYRARLDGGELSADAYWSAIAADCGVSWDAAKRQALWCADMRGWLTADQAVVALLEALHAGGTRLALLSNAAEEYGSLFRFAPIGRWFEQVFVSGELRTSKPDPAVYLHVCRELGIAPDRLVFVDNRDVNVRGAESIGAAGHVFTGAEPLREFLTALADRD